MRRPNYTRLVQKKHKTKYYIDTRFFYNLEDHKKFARRCEESGIVWLNLLREFMHQALTEELKRYDKHLQDNNLSDETFQPWLGYHTRVRARSRFENLKQEYKDEKIRLHKAFYVLHAKTGKAVNPHLIWLMRDQHKVDDHALFEHLLEMMVQEGTLEEEINTMTSGEEYYKYKPTVTIKTKRFNKKYDNRFVDTDLKVHETASANVKAGINSPVRIRRGKRDSQG